MDSEKNVKCVFKRYELKYLMNESQTKAVSEAIALHMEPDGFAHSSIRNIYFDTEDYLLARRSIEKPLYKEKLRVRSYNTPEDSDTVFVELKKKYDSVVYKRRLTMPLGEAREWLCSDGGRPNTQIGEEIDYMKVRYPGLRPAMFLSYERDSFRGEKDLRITLDSDIKARTEDLDLRSGPGGHEVLPEGYTLMEIKTMYGYSAWLRETLSSAKLYKSSFTKYGNAYKEMIVGRLPEEYYGIPGADATVVKRPFAYAAHVPASNSVNSVAKDLCRITVRNAGEVGI